MKGLINMSLFDNSEEIPYFMFEKSIEEVKPEVIDKFENDYIWLSNSYIRPQKSLLMYFNGVEYQDIIDEFPSVEHAYQASRTLDRREQVIIRDSISPERARKLGRKVSRIDWDSKRINVMKRLIFDKFNQHLDLTFKLLLTKNAKIINPVYDQFWGIGKNKKGSNILGSIIMNNRSEIIRHRGNISDLLNHFLNLNNLDCLTDKITLTI
jgi:hypothetical protein